MKTNIQAVLSGRKTKYHPGQRFVLTDSKNLFGEFLLVQLVGKRYTLINVKTGCQWQKSAILPNGVNEPEIIRLAGENVDFEPLPKEK